MTNEKARTSNGDVDVTFQREVPILFEENARTREMPTHLSSQRTVEKANASKIFHSCTPIPALSHKQAERLNQIVAPVYYDRTPFDRTAT